jgi:glycosyltransferase involved in cell wall biosynthesis
MILIDALFIANEGGGPNLLRYLLDAIQENGQQSNFFLFLDERFQYNINGFAHIRSKGSLLLRRRFYLENKARFSKVFCFANTPPPVKMGVPVLTYFHNQMLLESKRRLADRRYFRFLMRYAFVALWNKNTDEYLVQTPHMVDEIVSAGLKMPDNCKEFPFFKMDVGAAEIEVRKQEFVYVSAASFYKNHSMLLKAWEYLFNFGLKPTLHLTVTPDYSAVLSEINRLQQKGISIINHGYTATAPLYSKHAYMIYPSLNESFGLSLIEGANVGMKILAADLPYVRSVIKASAYFDPRKVESIAQAVITALRDELVPAETVINDQVNGLIDYILN